MTPFVPGYLVAIIPWALPVIVAALLWLVMWLLSKPDPWRVIVALAIVIGLGVQLAAPWVL